MTALLVVGHHATTGGGQPLHPIYQPTRRDGTKDCGASIGGVKHGTEPTGDSA
jgi:hypothetical protein